MLYSFWAGYIVAVLPSSIKLARVSGSFSVDVQLYEFVIPGPDADGFPWR
jgi:hypothetical protein